MPKTIALRFASLALAGALLACSTFSALNATAAPAPTIAPTANQEEATSPLLPRDEPVLVSGTIPYTWPFFENTNIEPFILLEDQAGFVARDLDFEWPLESQTIGPVWTIEEGLLGFSLSLPAEPNATLLDVDNNDQADTGVMIFAVAYWNNTWGHAFLEERDGTGWSGAYASTRVNSDRDGEIEGGTLLIWAPNDQQEFPTGFGEDNRLFTEDDPVAAVPAGYSFVDLDAEPFRVYKQAHLELELIEGDFGLRDYSQMNYEDAWETLFERVSTEYPFTELKGIDWDALYAEVNPLIDSANSDDDFYRALRTFTYLIPDAHVGISFNTNVFFQEQAGGFGLVLEELSDGGVIVEQVLLGYPGANAGIQVGAEILAWDGQPVAAALDAVVPYFSPFSNDSLKRVEQLNHLPRGPVGQPVEITFQNPGEPETTETLVADFEIDSLFAANPFYQTTAVAAPLQAQILPNTNIGYIRIDSFSDDPNMAGRLWIRALEEFNELGVQDLIIDLRLNGGGSAGLAYSMAEYLYDEEVHLWGSSSYNDLLGEFEEPERYLTLEPQEFSFDGEVVLLISPYCISACEGFAYALTSTGRAIAIGHDATAGAFGAVGGQYKLPGDYDMQFPTVRSMTPDGMIVLEDLGVVPDIFVPVTYDEVVNGIDVLLNAAIEALQ